MLLALFGDCAAAALVTWDVRDAGFIMGLSARDVTHSLVPPGGPSILEAIAGKLELRDEQLAHSWEVLREHGNCSSATVLMVLDEAMKSGATHPGEWGVMMAFGPGLTLEMCLLRF